MPCSNCDHTVQNVSPQPRGVGDVFWCPRCGAVKVRTATSPEEFGETSVPRWTVLIGTKSSDKRVAEQEKS